MTIEVDQAVDVELVVAATVALEAGQ
jgi:hypothetical protein